MKHLKYKNPLLTLGLLLAALVSGADADSQTRTRVTDRTTVRHPDSDITVTTVSQGTTVRTTHDSGQWETISAGTVDKTTETDWQGEWTETGWATEAGIKKDHKSQVTAKTGNSERNDMGRASLEDRETVWAGEAGPRLAKTLKGDLGQVTLKASAGVEGSVRQGDNGYEARGQVGVEAGVKASTRTLKAGTRNLGASLRGSGKLEVAAIAKGRLGAYVDEKGITFGAEGSAGVYAKGELKMNMEAHVFGIKTNVNLVASGYAGALAEGKAMVTLGWNGKVSFVASLGASLGFGGGVAVEFEVDAEELVKKLNFADIDDLLAWLKDFQENPMPVLTKLGISALRKLHESGFAALRKLGQGAVKALQHQVLKPLQASSVRACEGLAKGLAFLGRVVRSPAGEEGAVRDCLEEALAQSERLEAGAPLAHSPWAFPVCLNEGGSAYEAAEWDGSDPYAWYPFNWPQPYQWPSL